MAEQIEVEDGQMYRFVRIQEEVKVGSNHLYLVSTILKGEELLAGDTLDDLELRKNWIKIMANRFDNDSSLVDMGMITRRGDNVIVGKISTTFNYPTTDVFEMTRARTMEVLGNLYPGEKFVRRDN